MTYPGRRAGLGVLLAVSALLATAAQGPARTEKPEPWVRAWGSNAAGQLGNGATLDQQTPSAVRGLARDDVRELAGGGNATTSFAVAVLNNGTVQAWGNASRGQLGDGTTASRSYPAAVAGLSGASGVAAGIFAAYAVRNGRVFAWGDNTYGQLGNGSTAASTEPPTSRPVSVQSLNKVKGIAAGCNHVAALREDGSVWTWGRNNEGQLGDGSTSDRNTPQRVAGLQDIVSVAAGCTHMLALTADGTVKAWGRGANGQLGNDSTTASPVPVNVQHLKNVVGIVAVSHHSFALLDDGTVRGGAGTAPAKWATAPERAARPRSRSPA